MSDFPLAYHITFGTCGTRLHGDERGTVDRRQNRPGDPIIGRDPDWEALDRCLMRFAPIRLTHEQRVFAERTAVDVCKRGDWLLHNVAARPDHVHVCLSASRDGEAIRKWFKRWLGEALSEGWPLEKDQSWWSVGGSVKWVWDSFYLQNVYEYLREQRTIQG